MNIPKPLLAMIDTVVVQLRTEIDGKPARRIRTVSEMIELDPETKDFVTNEVYRWNVKDDAFSYSGRSYVLDRIMESLGRSEEEIREELDRRRLVLEWMAKNNIRKYNEVATVIREYYANPDRVYRRARLGMR